MKKDSRVKAVISLDAVEHNFREMRKNIAEETKMIAVIKLTLMDMARCRLHISLRIMIISGDLRLQLRKKRFICEKPGLQNQS